MGCLSDQGLINFQLPQFCDNINVKENTDPNAIYKAKEKDGISKFVFKGETKDGLHVYVHTNDKYRLYYEAEGIYCPLCNQPIEPLEFEKMKKLQLPNYKASIRKYLQLIGSNQYDIFEELEELAEQIEKERKYVEELYYKYKCPNTNNQIYLKLYDKSYILNLYGVEELYDYNYWKNNPKIKEVLIESRKQEIDQKKKKEEESKRRREEASYGGDGGSGSCKVSSNGYCNGKPLWGRVRVVNSYPDFKVAVVSSYPDLRVQKVSSYPDSVGRWQFVNSYEDFSIQYVTSYPDFTIQFVDSYPGVS